MADLLSALLAAQEKASQDAGAPFSQIGATLLAQQEPVIPHAGFWGNFALGAAPGLAGGLSYAYGQHLQDQSSATNSAALAKALIESDPAVAQQTFESLGGDPSVSPYLVAQKQGLIEQNKADMDKMNALYGLKQKAQEVDPETAASIGQAIGLPAEVIASAPKDKPGFAEFIKVEEGKQKAAQGKPVPAAILNQLGGYDALSKDIAGLKEYLPKMYDGAAGEDGGLGSGVTDSTYGELKRKYNSLWLDNPEGQYSNALNQISDALAHTLNGRTAKESIAQQLRSLQLGGLSSLSARQQVIDRISKMIEEDKTARMAELTAGGYGGPQQATPAAAVAPQTPQPQVSALPQQQPTPSNLPDPLGIR